MSRSWDYIVVGGGHNGLSAACTLADAGKSVVVVEKLPFLGGLSASHPYVEAAPHHLLSMGAMDNMFMASTSLATDLELSKFGYSSVVLEHPYGWMNEDGDTLLLFADFERTISEIARFSRRDAETYRTIRHSIDFLLGLQARFGNQPPRAFGKLDLARLAMKLAGDKEVRRFLGRAIATSAYEMIGETFESDAMRGLWAFWSGMLGPGDLDGTGVYIVGFGLVHRSGVHRPIGGMSGLVGAMERRFRRKGGEILIDSAVVEIVVDEKHATGVRLENGDVLGARSGVLASCAPQITLGNLVADGVLDKKVRDRIGFIPANSANVAPFKIDIAVGGRIGLPRAEAKRQKLDGADVRKATFMTGTLEDHVEQLAAMKAGSNVAVPPVYMAILSANDSTIAPRGGDVFYLHSNVPAVPVGGWTARKATTEELITASATRFVDGLDAEIGRTVMSPADFESRFGTPKGCYFHVDMLPTRLGANRPAVGLGNYSTPVDRLYIAGAGAHPGGGVSGWPGRLAAQEALARN
ncbi:MAG TPA: NAD(P)/FAD-dependent oxidoreductase [Sphingomicrobium sp.]|nr:NAD(P)/FAD-dependent oxidoreductase [Sphingomicrobium sp.]